MTRPHAADDFPAIRARMEELRRERDRMSVNEESGSIVPRRAHSSPPLADRRPVAPYIRRLIRTDT